LNNANIPNWAVLRPAGSFLFGFANSGRPGGSADYVAVAGSDYEVGAIDANIDLLSLAWLAGFLWNVADVVLSPKLFGNPLEGPLQPAGRGFRAEDAAAGSVGKFFEILAADRVFGSGRTGRRAAYKDVRKTAA
jgi:hypothetical protein